MQPLVTDQCSVVIGVFSYLCARSVVVWLIAICRESVVLRLVVSDRKVRILYSLNDVFVSEIIR